MHHDRIGPPVAEINDLRLAVGHADVPAQAGRIRPAGLQGLLDGIGAIGQAREQRIPQAVGGFRRSRAAAAAGAAVQRHAPAAQRRFAGIPIPVAVQVVEFVGRDRGRLPVADVRRLAAASADRDRQAFIGRSAFPAGFERFFYIIRPGGQAFEEGIPGRIRAAGVGQPGMAGLRAAGRLGEQGHRPAAQRRFARVQRPVSVQVVELVGGDRRWLPVAEVQGGRLVVDHPHALAGAGGSGPAALQGFLHVIQPAGQGREQRIAAAVRAARVGHARAAEGIAAAGAGVEGHRPVGESRLAAIQAAVAVLIVELVGGNRRRLPVAEVQGYVRAGVVGVAHADRSALAGGGCGGPVGAGRFLDVVRPGRQTAEGVAAKGIGAARGDQRAAAAARIQAHRPAIQARFAGDAVVHPVAVAVPELVGRD